MSGRPAPVGPAPAGSGGSAGRPARSVRSGLLGGGALVLTADALQGPVALLIAAYLARRLGVQGLALYLLAASVAGWLTIAVSSLFSRATVQLVGETVEWRAIASLILRWHVGIGTVAGAALFAAARPLSRVLGSEELAPLLALFALELPLAAAARAHTQTIVGLGRFRRRAVCGAAGAVARLVLVVVLVESGLGVSGAVWGSIGAAGVELVVARGFLRLPLALAAPAGVGRRLFDHSLPLFGHGVALQLFHRLGLLLMVPLGGGLAAAGVYGAAQSLLRVRRVLGQSLTPLLLSALTRLRRDGEPQAARELARDALSWSFYPLPVVTALAGASPELMAWIFGPGFAAGGAVLTLLLATVPALLLLSVGTAILVSAGRPRTPVLLSAPMVTAAALGMAATVPRIGALGAAASTAASGGAGAIALLVVLARLLAVTPSWATVARCLSGSAVSWLVVTAVPAEGPWLLAELAAGALAGLAVVVALGEQRTRVRRALALLRLGGRPRLGGRAGERDGGGSR